MCAGACFTSTRAGYFTVNGHATNPPVWRRPGRVIAHVLRLPAIILACAAATGVRAAQVDAWLDVVRDTPYWASQGVAQNLTTLRRWVLLGTGYCSKADRQILFDRRGRFVGYIENARDAAATLVRLNQTRQELASQNRIGDWSPGTDTSQGYPFALACEQPDVDMDEAIGRMTGTDKDALVWGTWDGMRVGSAENPVSLIALMHTVHTHLEQAGRITLPPDVMRTFVGEVMIESGAKKHALSTQAARGIMQLTPDVLRDCEIPQDFRLHRMAQVDCALRLVDQNDRNLKAPFAAVFGALPEEKRARLYRLLLTQAYQIGVGRTIELLQDPELGKAARYFAAHPDRFSAADIQVGMIYHNLGRRDIGLMTLFYVTDVGIASDALCATPAMRGDVWCTPTAQ